MTLDEITREFMKGCTCGAPGECKECLDAFISAVTKRMGELDKCHGSKEMEVMKVLLGQPDEYDLAVHSGCLDIGDLTVITKDHGMKSGKACAVLTFHVEIGGKLVQVQTVTSMKNLMGLGVALKSRYDDSGKLLLHRASDGSENETGRKN